MESYCSSVFVKCPKVITWASIFVATDLGCVSATGATFSVPFSHHVLTASRCGLPRKKTLHTPHLEKETRGGKEARVGERGRERMRERWREEKQIRKEREVDRMKKNEKKNKGNDG